MIVAASAIGSMKHVDSNNENVVFQSLREELEKGIQSMKNEELYTIEEAYIS